MGAWIEILLWQATQSRLPVAPLVGAWIEINVMKSDITSLLVAPLVGAWIEIERRILHQDERRRRSSRGSVD